MLLDNTFGLVGYWTYLNLSVMFLLVYFKQNINLKIQMLAEKEAKTYFEVFLKSPIFKDSKISISSDYLDRQS